MRTTKAQKVADAIRELAQREVREGKAAAVSYAALAGKLRQREYEVGAFLAENGPAVWGSLPLGWLLQVDELGVTVQRREGKA